MKVFITIAYIFVISLFVAAAVAQESDDHITKAVRATLIADESLAGAGIDVSTKDGVVTLEGKVIGHQEAEHAVELVRSVRGVKDVVSKLKADVHITNEDVQERLEAREETSKEQNEQKKEAVRSQDDDNPFDDAGITTAVKLKLAADKLGSIYRIDVDTKDGVVSLTGNVKSEAEAQRFIQLAEEVDGVQRVVSVITVKP